MLPTEASFDINVDFHLKTDLSLDSQAVGKLSNRVAKSFYDLRFVTVARLVNMPGLCQKSTWHTFFSRFWKGLRVVLHGFNNNRAQSEGSSMKMLSLLCLVANG